MQIDLLPLLTGALSFVGGVIIGRLLGQQLYELKRVKRVLRAKNPELWDLEHFVSVDEQQERTTRKTNKK